MQPMQQVMSEAESILATEPKVGFNIGQAKKELIKVNVRLLTVLFFFDHICCEDITKNPERCSFLYFYMSTENDRRVGND